MFRSYLRKFNRVLLMFYSCLVNRQTITLLLLTLAVCAVGMIYCRCVLEGQPPFRWTVRHLFDLSEVRRTLASEDETLWTKIFASLLYLFTWVFGGGVLISVLIDEKIKWVHKNNVGVFCPGRNIKNHIIIFGWDEMACSLIKELAGGSADPDGQKDARYTEKVKKIIILSQQKAEDIRNLLLRYQIDIDSTPTEIALWNGEYDSYKKLKLLRPECSSGLYVFGNQGEPGHDYRIMAFLDELVKHLSDHAPGKLPCYVLIYQYSLYWDLVRSTRCANAQNTLQLTPINYYENWCKHLWSALPMSRIRHYPHLCERFDSAKNIALVIVGFSEMGQTMLIEAMRVAHFAGNRITKALIVAPDAKSRWKEFQIKHPDFETVPDFEFLSPVNDVVISEQAMACLTELKNECQLTVAITYNNTDSALADATFLKQRLGNGFTLLVRENISIVSVANWNTTFSNLYQWGDVYFFGKRCDSAYAPWKRVQLAQILHEMYLDSVSAKLNAEQDDAPAAAPIAELKTKKKESQKEWEDLETQYRWKYLNSIDAMPEILHSAGIEIVPKKDVKPGQKEVVWTPEELEMFAETSHNRWWTDRILEGWHYGETYDKVARTAPNMKRYSEIDKTKEDKDRDFAGKFQSSLEKIGYQLIRIEPEPEG